MTAPGHADRMLSLGIGLPLRTDGTEPCIGRTDLFFPDMTKHAAARSAIEQAIALCGTCHRRQECLDGAIARRESVGVWGGVSMWTSKPPGPAKEPKPPKVRREPPPPKDPPRKRTPSICGTAVGHARHLERDEPPCIACRRAWIRSRRQSG